jgi:hypothetical protein
MGVFDRSHATQETIMTAAMGQLSEITSSVATGEPKLVSAEQTDAEVSA